MRSDVDRINANEHSWSMDPLKAASGPSRRTGSDLLARSNQESRKASARQRLQPIHFLRARERWHAMEDLQSSGSVVRSSLKQRSAGRSCADNNVGWDNIKAVLMERLFGRWNFFDAPALVEDFPIASRAEEANGPGTSTYEVTR